MQTLMDPFERASEATPAPRPVAPSSNGKVETGHDRRIETQPSRPPDSERADGDSCARMRCWCSEDY
jgi:hypothetical protein